MRSAEGSPRSSTCTHQQSHAAAAGRTSSAPGLPHEPDAERAALGHEAGACVQLARIVADQVAEQAERGRAPARRRRADAAGRTVAPRLA